VMLWGELTGAGETSRVLIRAETRRVVF
jgi:hypothetical protein